MPRKPRMYLLGITSHDVQRADVQGQVLNLEWREVLGHPLEFSGQSAKQILLTFLVKSINLKIDVVC
jgi:hypothetical protein